MSMFYKLLSESRRPGTDFWDKSEKEPLSDACLQVIKKGLDSRPDRQDGKTFWDDFLSVIGNNISAASDLFGVSRDVIAGWSGKIREGIQAIKSDEQGAEKADMQTTGDSY